MNDAQGFEGDDGEYAGDDGEYETDNGEFEADDGEPDVMVDVPISGQPRVRVEVGAGSGSGAPEEVETDYANSEYAASDVLRSLCTTDEEGEFSRWVENGNRRPQFNMATDLKDSKFEVGMTYQNAEDVKAAIHAYAIKNRREVFLKRNDRVRIRAQCRDNKGCKWALQVSWSDCQQQWEIRTYKDKHICNLIRNIRFATAQWIAKERIEHIRSHPNESNEGLRAHVRTTSIIEISRGQKI